MLYKNQGTELCVFFLRTWECYNQPLSKSFGDCVFQRGGKKKKIKIMAGEAMKLHHSQWRFCTTVKV